MSLQEKLQVTVPAPEEAGESWVPFERARDINRQEWRNHVNAESYARLKLNHMPAGMEMSNQCSTEQSVMPMVMSGEGDVTPCTTPESFAHGFVKLPMSGCDDQYTGEHVDHFYGDAGGFVERNNYLDRI